MLSLAARATMIAIKPKMVLWGIVLLAASAFGTWSLSAAQNARNYNTQQKRRMNSDRLSLRSLSLVATASRERSPRSRESNVLRTCRGPFCHQEYCR